MNRKIIFILNACEFNILNYIKKIWFDDFINVTQSIKDFWNFILYQKV